MPPNSGESAPNIEFSVPESGEQATSQSPETVSSTPENSPQQSIRTSSQVATDLALPASAMVPTTQPLTDDQNHVPAKGSSSSSDRIDKIWLDRLKSVIDQTREDPFEQKKALSKVQAEYIKQNFNKTIKTSDTTD